MFTRVGRERDCKINVFAYDDCVNVSMRARARVCVLVCGACVPYVLRIRSGARNRRTRNTVADVVLTAVLGHASLQAVATPQPRCTPARGRVTDNRRENVITAATRDRCGARRDGRLRVVINAGRRPGGRRRQKKAGRQ